MGYALTVLAMAEITDLFGKFDLKKMFDGKRADQFTTRAQFMAALSRGYQLKQRVDHGETVEAHDAEYYLALPAPEFTGEFKAAMKAVTEGMHQEIRAEKQ